MDEETSTTAGDDEGRDDRDEATSSSDASTTPVTPGFWHHGVWVNRPRTPAEHRRHVGGGGLKRLLKREARMNSYFKGDWKPRWLCDYIDQKAKREQVLAADDDKNEQPGEADDESTEVASNPWAELGWWTQDEWQQWWSWNGLQNGTSSSSPSAWQSSSTTWPSSSTSTSTTSWATSWTTSSSSGVSSLRLSPSWLYLESSYLWWGDLAWLFALVGEVESTTSTTSSSSLPPNHGLLPLVGPAQPIVKMQMELTGAETAVLQEAAVPQQTLARLQSMMEMLDRHQAEGRGPEARWALGCLLRRLDEGTQALDVVLGVLSRRLVPRGYLPVRRFPAAEGQRWHIYSWARNYISDLVFVVDRHLQTGLTPDDQHFPQEGGQPRPPRERSPPSIVASEAQASTPREAVSITDEEVDEVHESSGSSQEEPASPQSLDSDWALDEHGDMVRVPPASPGDVPRGPPPPEPVNAPCPEPDDSMVGASSIGTTVTNTTEGHGSLAQALRGELLGIWREPSELGTIPAVTSSSVSDVVATLAPVDDMVDTAPAPSTTSTTLTGWLPATDAIVLVVPALVDPCSSWSAGAILGSDLLVVVDDPGVRDDSAEDQHETD